MSDTPLDINVILTQLVELQNKIKELESLKNEVRDLKEINSLGDEVKEELKIEEYKKLKEQEGIVIPHIEKVAEKVLFPRRTKKSPLLESEIVEALNTTKSARKAARKLGVSYQTYKKYARMYGVHRVCPPTKRREQNDSILNPNKGRYPLSKILNNELPNFPIHRIKDKLIRAGLKKLECEQCGFSERRITDGKIPLLLNFEDGNIKNHSLENLKVMCYNCTFCSGRGFIKRGTVHFNMDPDVMQGAKKPLQARF